MNSDPSQSGSDRADVESAPGDRSQPGRDPPAELLLEAKKSSGGWVYEIVGSFPDGAPEPPEAIRGAWKVDDEGRIEGAFIPNERYHRR